MDPSQITDRTSLEAWLEDQPREIALAIADRAAMRVAPIYWQGVAPTNRNPYPARGVGVVTAIPISRALLVCAIARHLPFPAISCAYGIADRYALAAGDACSASAASSASGHAARAAGGASSATFAAYFTATHPFAPKPLREAVSAVDAAVKAAADFSARSPRERHGVMSVSDRHISANLGDAMWSEIRADGLPPRNGKQLRERPLWNQPVPLFGHAWSDVSMTWSAAGPDWDFWRRWYQFALDGRPLIAGDWAAHWQLLERIATEIDPDDSQGLWSNPTALAAEIRRIETDFRSRLPEAPPTPEVSEYQLTVAQVAELKRITDIGEDVVTDSGSGKLTSVALVDIDDYSLDDVIDRLNDALANLPEPSDQDPYFIVRRDAERLQRVVDRSPPRPVRIYQVCVEVVRMIHAREKNGECPTLNSDADLSGFVTEVTGAAMTLQSHDRHVQAYSEPRVQNALDQISDQQISGMIPVLDDLQAESEGELLESVSEDRQTLSDPDSDLPARRSAAARTVSRIVRVYDLVLRGRTSQTVQLAAAIYALEPLLAPWVLWLWNLIV